MFMFKNFDTVAVCYVKMVVGKS